MVMLFVVAPGISASPSEENMRYFNVMILGPTQSPYEGIELITLKLLFLFALYELFDYGG